MSVEDEGEGHPIGDEGSSVLGFIGNIGVVRLVLGEISDVNADDICIICVGNDGKSDIIAEKFDAAIFGNVAKGGNESGIEVTIDESDDRFTVDKGPEDASVKISTVVELCIFVTDDGEFRFREYVETGEVPLKISFVGDEGEA